MPQVKIKVYGKDRIIRRIEKDSKKEFYAFYKWHDIRIDKEPKDSPKPWYAIVITPEGGIIMDGWFDGPRQAVIKRCLENILFDEKQIQQQS